LVELDIKLPIDIDLPDLTLTLPREDAVRLKAILEALMERLPVPEEAA
jgi:hypothetical protein